MVMFGNHLMYVKDLNSLFKSWRCQFCQHIFNRHSNYVRHMTGVKCNKGQRQVYVGDGYRPPKSLFERLERLGYIIPDELLYFPYRAVFDMESLYTPPENLAPEYEKMDIPATEVLVSTRLPSRVLDMNDADAIRQFRQQYQPYPGLAAVIYRNCHQLQTNYQTNGRVTLRLPEGPLHNSAGLDNVRQMVRNYTHLFLCMQDCRFTLDEVVLLWVSIGDNSLYSGNCLPTSATVNCPVDGYRLLDSLTLNDLPEDSYLVSMAFTIKQHKQDIREELLPVSWAVRSNVPGLDSSGHDMTTPKCGMLPLDTQPEQMTVAMDNLVRGLYDYLNEVSTRSYELLQPQYQFLLDDLRPKHFACTEAQKKVVTYRKQLLKKRFCNGDTQEMIEARLADANKMVCELKDYADIYTRLERHLLVLPVCGYNSARFDVNLIKKQLFNIAVHSGDAPNFVIKRNSAYMAVNFKRFVLLDICNFNADGVSLQQFMQSWDVPDAKG